MFTLAPAHLWRLGLVLDADNNRAVQLTGFEALQLASAESSVEVIVTQTCEQLMIAKEVRC